MEKVCMDTAKNINKACKEETFYESGRDFIRRVLKLAKIVNVETGKNIVEGLWKKYGNKSLEFLYDVDIDFGINIDIQGENTDATCISRKLRYVFGPLIDIKIAGIKIFKFFIDYYERKEKEHILKADLVGKDKSNYDYEDEMEEGELIVDWEGMYETKRSEIVNLVQEGKYKEAKEEIKEIPLDERVKIVQRKFEVVRKVKRTTVFEAVSKYVKNEADQKKCFKILKDIKEGCMRIEDRNGYCSGDQHVDKRDFFLDTHKVNDPLLKASQKAIEANDLPSLITLSKGCFIPSVYSICLDFEKKTCSLFEYSSMVHAVDCALYLLEAGGGIDQKLEQGDMHLHQALRRGNEEIGMFLIKRGANCKARGLHKSTVLHAASAGNCFEVAKLLIERGADIEASDNYDQTPLHIVAKGNSVEVAKLLIAKGANVKAKNWVKQTPLHVVAEENSYDVAKLLIERGADIEATNNYGNTPLHSSAKWNSYEVAKLLIERGANIEAKDEDKNTPLHDVAWKNRFEIAKLLIEKGADIEVKDKDGRTPLHITSWTNSCAVAKLLIERGADIEAKDKYGKTPLHFAAEENRVEVSKLLIERGADIEAKNKYRETPLHMAVYWNRVEVAKLLIERGADIEAKDKNGDTPLQVTRNYGTQRILAEVAAVQIK